MEVERTFDISIPDQDAAKLETVGKLFDYLKSKCSPASAQKCATSSAYYELRAATARVCSIDRRELRPTSALDDIFGASTRRERWSQVSQSLKHSFRPLVPSRWVLVFVFSFSVIAGLLVGFEFGLGFGVVVAVVGLIVLMYLSRPLWSAFPAAAVSLGDLARIYASDNYAVTLAASGWNDRQAWEVLTAIIVEQLGVRPEQVTRDARFIQDLGAD